MNININGYSYKISFYLTKFIKDNNYIIKDINIIDINEFIEYLSMKNNKVKFKIENIDYIDNLIKLEFISTYYQIINTFEKSESILSTIHQLKSLYKLYNSKIVLADFENGGTLFLNKNRIGYNRIEMLEYFLTTDNKFDTKNFSQDEIKFYCIKSLLPYKYNIIVEKYYVNTDLNDYDNYYLFISHMRILNNLINGETVKDIDKKHYKVLLKDNIVNDKNEKLLLNIDTILNMFKDSSDKEKYKILRLLKNSNNYKIDKRDNEISL